MTHSIIYCFNAQEKSNASSVFHCRNVKQKITWTTRCFERNFLGVKKPCVINYKPNEFPLKSFNACIQHYERL